VVAPEILRDRRIFGTLTQMGQVPLNPPNVKGWPGGRAWINTSTLFVRNNTAIFLAGGEPPAMHRGPGPGGGPPMMGGMFGANAPARIKLTTKGGTANEVVDEWIAKLIQRPIGEDRRKVLLDALDNRPGDEAAVKKMVQLLVTMPEFQLC
jgi:hypothetical protein